MKSEFPTAFKKTPSHGSVVLQELYKSDKCSNTYFGSIIDLKKVEKKSANNTAYKR